jgi:hypothetical protein
MYKKFSTLIIAILLISNISFANIFRVGYSGPQVAGVDFTAVTSAVTAAATNDTIQIYPGINISNGSIYGLNKKLVFIGAGYFLNNNPNLQIATDSALLQLNMDTGASGSIFEGLAIAPEFPAGFVLSGGIIVQNLLFKRCKIIPSPYQNNPLGFSLNSAGDSLKNITFSQCYFSNISIIFSGTDNTKIAGIDFQNCIFDNSNGPSAQFYTSGTTGIITNITFENCNSNGFPTYEDANISTYYRNCIFRNEPGAPNSDVFDYCTFESNSATHFVTGTSDQFGKLLTDVFSGDVSSGTEWDATWTLKSGSPAIGYGRDFSNNVIDAGAFGSVNPYTLSGIPPVPAFYKLTSPTDAATTNPYTITFSVRANN